MGKVAQFWEYGENNRFCPSKGVRTHFPNGIPFAVIPIHIAVVNENWAVTNTYVNRAFPKCRKPLSGWICGRWLGGGQRVLGFSSKSEKVTSKMFDFKYGLKVLRRYKIKSYPRAPSQKLSAFNLFCYYEWTVLHDNPFFSLVGPVITLPQRAPKVLVIYTKSLISGEYEGNCNPEALSLYPLSRKTKYEHCLYCKYSSKDKTWLQPRAQIKTRTTKWNI